MHTDFMESPLPKLNLIQFAVLEDAINILTQKNQEDTQLTIQFLTLVQTTTSIQQKKVLTLLKKCTITNG
jgi:hypothetical protein